MPGPTATALILIFDEIFTGFGRTGTMFVCEAAGVVPDIVTLSKALTGGTMALAATVASDRIFAGFWSDDPGQALMHGPTYMANALACAAAKASLDLFDREPRLLQVSDIEGGLKDGLAPCRKIAGIADVRVMGAVGVCAAGKAERSQGAATRLRRGRHLGPPLSRHRLSDAVLYDERG